MTYVLMVDDHPLFRAALKLAIKRAAPQAEVVEASSLSEAHEVVAGREPPRLALLDLHLPGEDGFTGLAALRQSLGAVPVAIVSGDENPATVRRVRKLGAAGFLPKSAELETMVEAISSLLDGCVWAPDLTAEDEESPGGVTLTAAQQRILLGLQKGLLNKQIAFDAGISEATVKAHMTAIFRKLGVQSRTQAVLAGQRWLSPG